MGVWREVGAVFVGVGQVPGMLWRSTCEMSGSAFAGGRPERKDSGQSGKSGGQRFARLLGLAASGYVLVYVTQGRAWLWWVYGGAWFVGCVVLAARRADFPDDGEAPEGEAGVRPGDADDAPMPASDDGVEHDQVAFYDWIRKMIGGANGVHLRTLLEDLHARGEEEVTMPALKALLAARGILFKDQVKVAGVNRPGVHRDDVPDGFTPLPEPDEPAVRVLPHLPTR